MPLYNLTPDLLMLRHLTGASIMVNSHGVLTAKHFPVRAMLPEMGIETLRSKPPEWDNDLWVRLSKELGIQDGDSIIVTEDVARFTSSSADGVADMLADSIRVFTVTPEGSLLEYMDAI